MHIFNPVTWCTSYPVQGSPWETPISCHTQSPWSWCRCNHYHWVQSSGSSEAEADIEVSAGNTKGLVSRLCVCLHLYVCWYTLFIFTFFLTKYVSTMMASVKARARTTHTVSRKEFFSGGLPKKQNKTMWATFRFFFSSNIFSKYIHETCYYQ